MHGREGPPYKVLVGKSEGERLLQKPKHRWEDNIKMYFKEIGWGAYLLNLSGSG
jgi:hypothetical protein